MMKALVKPATEPYATVIPETEWSEWMKKNLNYYTDYYGYNLIEDYNPPAPPGPPVPPE